jgi:hypothetical protein
MSIAITFISVDVQHLMRENFVMMKITSSKLGFGFTTKLFVRLG